jgi:histidinol-phosphate aminotransferase
MNKYEKPPELYAGLRLHQNENTGGCSPRVLEALGSIRADEVCVYPPYAAVTALCAEYLGVDPDRVSLVNGLDEGIMAVAAGYLRPSAANPAPEAIVPEPAFEILAFDTEVVGGTVVRVMPRPDFSFPLDAVLGSITERTRVVFLTNPNNPTGLTMSQEAIRTIARHLPPGAVVLVDEAYAEFSGETFIPDLPMFPNVIVGRTFSKAFGLAGLRIGAVIGEPATLEALRLAVPVYSVNIAAVVALRAALSDQRFMKDYLRQVTESKALLYAACERLGLAYWKSAANFVLVRVGGSVDALMEAALVRGVYLRDRSADPGCEGCLRITTGVVQHTERVIAVMEEVLCAAR